MSRLMIIGCGGVASVAIHKCCQNSEIFEEIMIASRTVSKCDALKEKLQPTTRTKITTAQVDADHVEELTALIFERAVERYKTLEVRDEDIHSEEMKETLAGREEITEFDEELYRKLIKQILVYKDNSVKVIFHNNNSIQIGYGEE